MRRRLTADEKLAMAWGKYMRSMGFDVPEFKPYYPWWQRAFDRVVDVVERFAKRMRGHG